MSSIVIDAVSIRIPAAEGSSSRPMKYEVSDLIGLSCDTRMHTGMLNIKDEKMSKSTGNIITVREACEKYGGLALRYLLLNASYRSEIIFTSSESSFRIAYTDLKSKSFDAALMAPSLYRSTDILKSPKSFLVLRF